MRHFLSFLYGAFAQEAARVRVDKTELVRQSREFLVVALLGLVVGASSLFFHHAVEKISHWTYLRCLNHEPPSPARARGHGTHANGDGSAGANGHAASHHARPAERVLPEYPPISPWIVTIGDGGHRIASPPGETEPSFPEYPPLSLWIVIIPALGGLGVGLLSLSLRPEYWGEMADVAIGAFHNRNGYTPWRVTATKMTSAAFTVGTGGSSGLEGPVMQGGSGAGSIIAEAFGMTPSQRRRMSLAGIAAGVGALFRAPLGGAFYAIEVLYRDSEFEADALLPAFLASIIAYSTYCSLAGQGWGAVFDVPAFEFNSPFQLLYYALMAVALAVMGGLFVKINELTRFVFKKRRFFPAWLAPAGGGLALGLLALKAPYVLGSSYGYLQDAMDGHFTVRFLITLALLKMVATSLTLGTGGAGGVFAPALVIGGMIGGAFGVAGQKLGIVDHAAPMIIVGMAAFFGGMAKAPVAAMIMALELTSGYGLLVPLMLCTGITYLLVPRFMGIHHSQVMGRRDSPAHRGEYVTDVLRELPARDLLDPDLLPPFVPQDMTLDELNVLFTRSGHETIPVVDADQNMLGVIYLNDIKEHLLTASFGFLILAADIMRRDFEPIKLGEDASQALGKLLATGADELPVVDEKAPDKVVGTLSRADIMRVYYDRMSDLASSGGGSNEG